MLDPLDGDDAGLLVVLPQGSSGGLQLLAVGDRLGDALRRPGVLALAGHAGLHRAAQPQGVLSGGRKHGGSAAAHGGDRDPGLAPIEPGTQCRRVHTQVRGDALHGREAGGVHGPGPHGHLTGEVLRHPRVEALGDLLEVGLDRGGLPPGPGLLEPECQQNDPHGVVLDPLGGGRVGQQEVQGLGNGLAVLVLRQLRVEGAAGRRQERRQAGGTRDRCGDAAPQRLVGQATVKGPDVHGPHEAGTGCGAALGERVGLGAGDDVGGDAAQGVRRVLKRPGSCAQGGQRLKSGGLLQVKTERVDLAAQSVVLRGKGGEDGGVRSGNALTIDVVPGPLRIEETSRLERRHWRKRRRWSCIHLSHCSGDECSRIVE